MSAKRTGYAVRTHTRQSLHSIALQPPASDSDKLHAAVIAEVEVLRLRMRALTATNTNLRRRVKDLESQYARKAAP